MDQRVQARQPLRSAKYPCCKHLPVDFTRRRQDFCAEFTQDTIVSLASRRQNLVSELVGLDHKAAVACQGLTDEAFSTGQAAGETDLQHIPCRRSAESTV